MSRFSTKKRIVQTSSSTGLFQTFTGNTLIGSSQPLVYDNMIQRTDSQGNPHDFNRKYHNKLMRLYGYDPRGSQDIGGPFTTYKVQSRRYPRRLFTIVGGNPLSSNWKYKGEFAAWVGNIVLTESAFLQPSTANVLNSYGTTAIARCIPTNPLAGMGQFLGELHELPRVPNIRLWKGVVRNARKASKRLSFDKIGREGANEYLNQVFGWAPFISDVQKLDEVLHNATPIMEKYAREANQLIHRSYYFPDEVSTTVTVTGNQYPDPPLNPYLITKSGTMTKTDTTTTKRWFKGAFTYYLPKVNPNDNGFVQTIDKWKAAEAFSNKLSGLRLTPDLAWKLAPWSWAADWVTNAGDVVHNWSSFASDGLVMNYGYIMETKIRHITYSLEGVVINGTPETFVQEIVYTTKSRLRATPYGFGVNPASFTAKQWSIIAALGISRQPLSLNF